MTTKEKLIALINSDDRSAVLLLADEVSELADQIICKLPEWGWIYDSLDDDNSEISQIGREIGEMSDEEFMKLHNDGCIIHTPGKTYTSAIDHARLTGTNLYPDYYGC